MPIVLRYRGYRFGFFASDVDEPAHVHVEHGSKSAKYWLTPIVQLEWNHGFKPHELNQIERIINDHIDALLESWREFFAR